MTASGPAKPIPLTVLTGFLGAGKTSLLNKLIVDPALAETAVIITQPSSRNPVGAETSAEHSAKNAAWAVTRGN